jgi:hypothetical protein
MSTDARARAFDQLGELAARPLGSDDETLADVRGQRQPGAVRFHQPPQTGDHGGVVGQDERVARLAKTFLREVQRRDERRPIVGDQVLRVVLHDGSVYGLTEAPVRSSVLHSFASFFLPPFAREVTSASTATPRRTGRRQLREHTLVGASEERQRDALPSLADHIEHGLSSLLDGHDESIGW